MILPGILASQISGHLGGDFESISTVTVGSGGSSTITFSSIPSTYKHLQIRGFAQCNRATYGTDDLNVRFNSDTGSNYAWHRLYGTGTAAEAGAFPNSNIMQIIAGTGTGNGNTFAATVIDILDYANTSKNKTMRTLSGDDLNGTVAGYGGYAAMSSGVWFSTAAISTITIVVNTGASFNQHTSFALYGIKE